MDILLYTSACISALAVLFLFVNMLFYLAGRSYVEGAYLEGAYMGIIPLLNVFLSVLSLAIGLVILLARLGSRIRSKSIDRRERKMLEKIRRFKDESEMRAAKRDRRCQILSKQNIDSLKAEDADHVVVSEKKPSWDEIAALASTKEE